MQLWKHIWQLLKIGFLSLFESNNGINNHKFGNFITYIGIPFLIVICSYSFSVKADGISDDILTTLSIFLAIALGVIFIVPDKLTKKIETQTSTNESRLKFLDRYKKFCILFIRRLSFVLVLSVIIIIASVVLKMVEGIIAKLLSAFILGLFTLAILSILKLIVDIYGFLVDEINSLKYQNGRQE